MPKGNRGGILNSSTRQRSGKKYANTSIGQRMKAVDNSSFKKAGFGQWTLDVPGVGGASILDETGSTAALRMGLLPGQKMYSMTAWDENGRQLGQRTYYQKLNDAKYFAKEELANGF